MRLLRTGANLGYGTAVNRAVDEYSRTSGYSDFFVVANPDVQWGPRSIDMLLDAAARWPRAGSLGPLIRDPDGSVYPSARHLPSLIRAACTRSSARCGNPTRGRPAYRQERLEPSERPVGWLSGSCLLLRRAAFDEVVGFDERYFMYMEDVDLGDRLGRRAGRTCTCRRRRFCTTRVMPPAATPPATWRPTTPAPTLSWQIGIRSGGRRRCGGRFRAASPQRAGLVVRNSRRKQAKGRR